MRSPPVLFAGLALLLCAATVSPARAEAPTPPSGAQRLQLAQRDDARCRNWAAQIQTMRNAYSAQCSGSLPPQQVARCNSMRQQIQDETQRYNAACAR